MFMTMVVGMLTNIMTRYGSFIYIYLIQSCNIPLRLQLIYINYWIGCLRKNKWWEVEQCGIKQMEEQSSIGVQLTTIWCLFYKNHIKLFLIEPLIHQVMEKDLNCFPFNAKLVVFTKTFTLNKSCTPKL